jgi:phage terminase large subunit-like protein
VVKTGRGWGKTRTAVEAVREVVNRDPRARIALVGPTAADCRDVMLEGESGLLSVFPPGERPVYWPSKRRVDFANGAMATLYSADTPERLRGPQHSFAVCDELAVYPDVDELWQNLKLGLRLGPDPRIIVTTTPKPSRFLRALLADAGTIVTSGSTWANRANLPASALADFERIYGGTRIGRQELEGELLEEAEGALWSRAQIEALRVREHPELVRIVVAIDPSVTATETSDECGIVACGLGADGHGYVLQDLSGRFPPDQWAHRAVSCFDSLEADRVIAESNNGGDLVMMVLRTVRQNLPFEKVTASRGKVARAEPVAALTEQGRIHFVGAFPHSGRIDIVHARRSDEIAELGGRDGVGLVVPDVATQEGRAGAVAVNMKSSVWDAAVKPIANTTGIRGCLTGIWASARSASAPRRGVSRKKPRRRSWLLLSL